MAIAETARLIASLELQDAKFSRGADRAIGKLGKLEGSFGRIGDAAKRGATTAAKNVAAIGAVAAVAIGSQVKAGLDSLAQLEDAQTSLTGAIAATGNQGRISAAEVTKWAGEIETAVDAAFDDKDITRAAGTLLRFGKVTPNNLRPALEVMTDLAVKTGSVDSAATLLGKALADPEKAAGKLARTGIVLTKSQQDQIKALTKAGKTAEAQAVVLRALEQTTKGAAKASAGPYRDSLNTLADVTEDAQRALGEGFLPVIIRVRDILQKQLANPKTISAIREFGKGAARGLDQLISIATKIPWSSVGDAMKLAGQGAKTILDAFTSLPPWVQTAVLTGWGLNKLTGGALGTIVGELGKGLVKGVLGMTAGVVNIKAAVVNGGGVGGVVPTPGGGGAVSRLVKGAGAVFVVGLGAEAAAQIGQAGLSEASKKFLENQPTKRQIQEQVDLLRTLRSGADFKFLGIGTGLDPFGNVAALDAQIAELEAAMGTLTTEDQRLTSAMGNLTDAHDRSATLLTKAIQTAARPKQAVETFRKAEKRVGSSNTFAVIKGAKGGDASIIPVVQSLVRALVQGNTPWARDMSTAKNHLANLKALEARFLATGDTKNAALIRSAINSLSGAITTRQEREIQTTRLAKQAVEGTGDAVDRTRGAVTTMQNATTSKLGAVQGVLSAVRAVTAGIVPNLGPKLNTISTKTGAIPGAIARNRPIVNANTDVVVNNRVNVSGRQVSSSQRSTSRFGYQHL